MCLIDDALEFGGAESAAKYYPQALVTFARAMKSEDVVLRQVVVYLLSLPFYRHTLLPTQYPYTLTFLVTFARAMKSEDVVLRHVIYLSFTYSNTLYPCYLRYPNILAI